MFQLTQIGKRIAELRKSKNLTQVELADDLGISYQAVSNWETGNSMPDIAKLEDLSKIFDISIDELLGNESRAKIVHGIINKEKIKIDDANTDSVVDVLPLIKPDEIMESFSTAEMDLNQLVIFAPFLNTDVLDKMFKETYIIGHLDALLTLTPFCSSEIIDELVEKELESGDIASSNSIHTLAPFLGKKTMDLFFLRVYQTQGIETIMSLAPFVSSYIIDEVIEQETKQGRFKRVLPLFPFASQSEDIK